MLLNISISPATPSKARTLLPSKVVTLLPATANEATDKHRPPPSPLPLDRHENRFPRNRNNRFWHCSLSTDPPRRLFPLLNDEVTLVSGVSDDGDRYVNSNLSPRSGFCIAVTVFHTVSNIINRLRRSRSHRDALLPRLTCHLGQRLLAKSESRLPRCAGHSPPKRQGAREENLPSWFARRGLEGKSKGWERSKRFAKRLSSRYARGNRASKRS